MQNGLPCVIFLSCSLGFSLLHLLPLKIIQTLLRRLLVLPPDHMVHLLPDHMVLLLPDHTVPLLPDHTVLHHAVLLLPALLDHTALHLALLLELLLVLHPALLLALHLGPLLVLLLGLLLVLHPARLLDLLELHLGLQAVVMVHLHHLQVVGEESVVISWLKFKLVRGSRKLKQWKRADWIHLLVVVAVVPLLVDLLQKKLLYQCKRRWRCVKKICDEGSGCNCNQRTFFVFFF